ncbi:MAG: 50S ribosomal protein L20 [Alphaproteobacteria bacterium]|nr:50S ribosomal protein L20 [Rickettsiales bacterium]
MPRASRSVPSRKRRKKVLKAASGYRSSKRYSIAHERVAKGLQHQYAHRRIRKRDMRSLWIVRVSAALKALGEKYSVFMSKLKLSNVTLNRKMLSKLAMEDPKAFETVVSIVTKQNNK